MAENPKYTNPRAVGRKITVVFTDASAPDDIGKGPHTPDEWFNIKAGFTRNTANPAGFLPLPHEAVPFSDLRAPAMSNVDASLNKRWKLNERAAEAQVRGEALNAFNHPQFGGPQMDQINSGFGQITTQANYARQMQLAIRASF